VSLANDPLKLKALWNKMIKLIHVFSRRSLAFILFKKVKEKFICCQPPISHARWSIGQLTECFGICSLSPLFNPGRPSGGGPRPRVAPIGGAIDEGGPGAWESNSIVEKLD